VDNILAKFAMRLPLVVIPVRDGILVTPPVSPKAQMQGTYESDAVAFLEFTLRSVDVFVDVGAHAGYYTLMAARLAKEVIAFEPNPSNYKFLRFNIFLNRLDNVKAVGAAVSDFNGHAKLYVPKQGGRSLTDRATLAYEGEDSVEVPVVTLDTFLEHIDSPSVIKIDVEGDELNIIKGALKTIAKGVRLIIVEIHSSDVKMPIIELLRNLGYMMREKGKFLFFFRSFSSSNPRFRHWREKQVPFLISKEMNESQNGNSEAL
jgi:FkbM family methyltransferase